MTALGAVVQLGAKEAVGTGNSRDFGDHREMRKIVGIIGDLGGAEAESYLELVSRATKTTKFVEWPAGRWSD